MAEHNQNIMLSDVRKNEGISTYITRSDEALSVMGYTDHSTKHTMKVAKDAAQILTVFGYSQREIELVQIAAYMHDIGNVINRVNHAQNGAIMAFEMLSKMNMPPEEIATIVSAIGNHDESGGWAVSNVSAALIIADKCDVHRRRVKNTDFATFDIHDRVNYAVEEANLEICAEERDINLKLKIDISICPVIDYFEIFLLRMMMSAKSATFLDGNFHLYVNDSKLL